MPTSPTIAPVRGQPSSYLDGVRADIVGRNSFAKNTKPFNYTGHPALAVPCGRSDGLPVSMQLVGRSFDDGLLLQVARAYERAVGWRSEEHTSELQSLMRLSYAVFGWQK